MARGKEAEKGRTSSRYASIKALYENCKQDLADYDAVLEQFKSEEPLRLRSDKLYLYYTQLGRCMYTGRVIDIDRLMSDNSAYDIDHIYPRSKIKDDSLTNRVLVVKDANQDKRDEPLSPQIQDKQKGFWDFLKRNNFISVEKYERLTYRGYFTEEMLSGFIARQLVETRQGTKTAGQILEQLYPDSTVVYCKAANTSEFRQKFNLIKCREINDFHHAHDAYLNIAVGNVYYTKFTSNPRNFMKLKEPYNLRELFDRDVERNNTIAWVKNKTITTIKDMLKRNTPLYTRYAYCKTGGFFDQNIMKKGKGQFPLKENSPLSDISKYGGYNKVSGAYFILVQKKEKDAVVRILETVPLYLLNKPGKESENVREYLSTALGTKDFKILIPKIKINSLFKINGFLVHITGKTNDRFLVRSAVQFFCDDNLTLFFKRIIAFNGLRNLNKDKSMTAYDDNTMRVYVRDNLFKDKNQLFDKNKFNEIVKGKNISVYKDMVKRYETSIYKFRPNTAVIPILKSGEDKFINLPIEEQFKILQEILKLFGAINGTANLTLIGGRPSTGEMKISNNISNLKQCILIHQSPTGVFEQQIDLLKI
ncbi:type II CRISPR RNA-guided endonuclease Cas9 [Treponema phagedenis]|nr:type II CRISPR RNA-guided endonuclease Cas9 [Treponema phagedenis]QEJ94056.1 type II CRISPR RNA-guided endonuclease Cas9 [Treponema phagedenis]